MSEAQSVAANVDMFDKSLWEITRTIDRCRSERCDLLRALRQRESELSAQCQSYQQLFANHAGLKAKYAHVCADLSHILKERGHLVAARQNEMSSYEALRIELQQAKTELATVDDWKVNELYARDTTIDGLREDIEVGKHERAQLLEKLNTLEGRSQVTAEAIQDLDEQQAELLRLREERSRLAKEVRSHNSDSEKWKDQAASLRCELESANSSVKALREVLDEVKKGGAQENAATGETSESKGTNRLQSLVDENMSLTMQLETLKDVLRAQFPELNDNLDNVQSVLSEAGAGAGRKKRKTMK